MPFIRIKEADGTFSHELSKSAIRFQMPAIDEMHLDSEPVRAFDTAADTFSDLIDKSASVTADHDLSDSGRAKKLEPLRALTFERLANAANQINRYEKGIDDRERTLTRVPALDPSHSAMAIEDREIRDWWRSQSVATRTSMLKAVQTQPAKHERLMIAVLRSPVPQLDHEVSMVLDAWNEGKRQSNPAEAVAIDGGRVQIEWARRGMAQVTGLVLAQMSHVGWDRPRVLRHILSQSNDFTHAGVGVFGFDDRDVAQMRERMKAEALWRKAA